MDLFDKYNSIIEAYNQCDLQANWKVGEVNTDSKIRNKFYFVSNTKLIEIENRKNEIWKYGQFEV